MPPSSAKSGPPFLAESFLRSVNLELDAEAPERIAHFRPTAKAVRLVASLAGSTSERAFFAIAPYGTGKSLACTYLLHLIENRRESSEILKLLAKRFAEVSPDFGDFARRRVSRSGRTQGIVLALHGAVEDLPAALMESLESSARRIKKLRQLGPLLRKFDPSTMEEAIHLLASVAEKCTDIGLDRIAIVWDEFGRHLETLVSDGRPAGLLDVQLLAEFASRCNSVPMSLGVVLHQNVASYAATMPESIRREWRKIEGRFERLEYIEDGREIVRLIAEIVSARRPTNREIPSQKARRATAKAALEAGLLKEFSSTTAVADLLSAAYPLEPATLHLLPRIAARVAQNERTLFSFLYAVDLKEGTVGADTLFDYFESSMRADSAVGGTHRQWLETQSAVAKTSDPTEASALKCACLLGLGSIAGRASASLDSLATALAGYGDRKKARATSLKLVERKLLLHRRHSDEVAVWHGTDLDLRSRLAAEKDRLASDFDVVSFLNREMPPPIWRPIQHNDRTAVRRYFESEYNTVEGLVAESNAFALHGLPRDCDGKIYYLIDCDTASSEDLDDLLERFASEPQVLLAFHEQHLAVTDAALEVAAILSMQSDTELTELDPLASEELRQLEDDSRSHLDRVLGNLLDPASPGVSLSHQSTIISTRSAADLRSLLSDICDNVFCHTPRILNESLNRKKPAPVMVNARKKLVGNILEFTGEDRFALYDPRRQHEVSTAVFSLYRTIVAQPGLYRAREDGRWGFQSPHAISDPGLSQAWEEIRSFFTEANATPKPLSSLVTTLLSPPYGIRAGLLPIFLACGMRAFPTAAILLREGSYVDDLKPSVIEEMSKDPDLFALSVLALDKPTEAYLRSVHKLFGISGTYEVEEPDLVRLCHEVLEAWRAQLPPAAIAAHRGISERTKAFRRALQTATDPVRLLLHDLPEIFETPLKGPKNLITEIEAAKIELESVIDRYTTQATDTIKRSLGFPANDPRSLRSLAHEWAEALDAGFVESIPDGLTKGIVSRLSQDFDSDGKLANSVAVSIDKAINRWDDGALANFDRRFRGLIADVESRALRAGMTGDASPEMRERLAGLLRGRAIELVTQLRDLAGDDAAKSLVDEIRRKPVPKGRSKLKS